MKRLAGLLLVMTLPACGIFGWIGSSGEYGYLQQAEELSRQARYSEAIDAYRKHMNYRLSLTKRPEWENPYFYLILIGDIQLGQLDTSAALQSFEEAERRGVDRYLLADRYRSVATNLESQGKLDEALAVLGKYRERDVIMFDHMADRIARAIIEREEAAAFSATNSR
jgi:hypothetical protein